MQSNKVYAFTLRNYPFGEAHQISVLFSRELGKIKVAVYGVRKAKSQWTAKMELLNQIDCVLQDPGRNSDIYKLKEASILHFFQPLRERYQSIAYLYYIAEYLDKVIPENDPHPDVYDLVYRYLDMASKHTSKLFHFIHSLELKILKALGFLSNLDCCSQCNEIFITDGKIVIAQPIHIGEISGWILCHPCSASLDTIQLSLGSYRYLRYLLCQPASLLHRLEIPYNIQKELNFCFHKLAISVIGKPLQSSKFLLSD